MIPCCRKNLSIFAPVLLLCLFTKQVASDDGHGRLIAYVGNWLPCPTPDQYAQYTHIVIAFAVSYTWSPEKNICSETCQIAEPPVCNNAPNPELIQTWKSQGKQVLLSFGGAGMGGSWNGHNDCWEYCFGRETQVVNQLTQIITNMDLDGIDLDYEYYHEDNQNGSGFSKGQEAQDFLVAITNGLRDNLEDDAIVTYAPMDPDAEPGTGMWSVFEAVANSLDFLMPQYYNGYVFDEQGLVSHMATIANSLFNGDMKKVVPGFCATECPGFNKDGAQSAATLTTIQQTYSCHGGAFFWVSNDDAGGSWSVPVSNALANMECGPSHPTSRVHGDYCGHAGNWADAQKCQTGCSYDSDCPNGEACYAAITCATPPPPPPAVNPTPAQTSGNFCGHAGNWADAQKCQTSCSYDSDCPNGEACYAAITCAATPSPPAVNPTSPQASGNYCGHAGNWADAQKCETACSFDSDCPNGEACYAAITCY